MSSWVDQAKRYVHAHDVATAAASATDAAPPPPPDWLLAAARLRSHRIREPTGGDLVRATRERVRKRRAERGPHGGGARGGARAKPIRPDGFVSAPRKPPSREPHWQAGA